MTTLWSGLDIDTDSARSFLTIKRFFSNTYVSEIEAAHPGLTNGKCYELLAGDRHRGFGSKLLITFEAKSAGKQAPTLPVLSRAPAAWRDHVTMSWSIIYKFVAETGPSFAPPYAIYLAGVNPPANMNEADRQTFVDFYTAVHIPEVTARKHCSRATAYELSEELLQPKEGTPRFLGVYEVEDEASVITSHVGFGYSRGPTVWQRHKTPWRIWYRRLTA